MSGLKWIALLVTGCVLVSGLVGPVYAQSPPATLTVHFIDVWDGSATLLAGPDFTILIDAGRDDRNDVVPYLQSVGVQSLDLLVGTHPHNDHIGQFPQVLNAFPVREIWLPGASTTFVFRRAWRAILLSEAVYHEPRAGEIYTIGSATVEVLNPAKLTGDLHRDSIVTRVIFGEVAFLFPGDAEVDAELAMIDRGLDLRSQVLELGHHGSSTSSSLEFLRAVQPEVAIYSAGLGNSSGHPSSGVLGRLDGLGILVFGTDLCGTIQITTDGETFHVQSERADVDYSSAPIRTMTTPTATPAATKEGRSEGLTDVNVGRQPTAGRGRAQRHESLG